MEQTIIKTTCEVFGISEAELFIKSTSKNKSAPRMAIVYVLHQHGWHYAEIAKAIQRSPKSFYHNLEIAKDLIEYDKDFKNKVTQIMGRSLK